ncbi:MAG: Response regulator of zinc sigma-54-dependent two-component system [Polyangiaceae bacterium]|nr:Response regulator of zinc sigma-54-dependent two-component system [Polyangiaceae bacterium]
MSDDPESVKTLELRAQLESGPFQVEVGEAEGAHRFELRVGQRVCLGSGPLADVLVSDRTVSGRHCELTADDRGVVVTDVGSKNGVFVGGARVPHARLDASAASFVIGRSTVTVRLARGHDPARSTLPGIVGCSEPMLRVAEEVRRHAGTRAPILIQGESGTGKDLVARAIHELGRPQGPYVPLNVGAIAESLADSELFGHRRGAFTGAVAHRQGAFEQAHQGTLFLDEVAELSSGVQVRLLRVVEDGQVRPLGAHTSTNVDVRIVSASWAGLAQRVEEGRFRGDLYHRLSTVTLKLPPLRERRSDIPALARVLLRRLERELGDKQLSTGALAVLVAHEWPGNVRELASVLYRSAALATGREILTQHLSLSVRAAGPRNVRDVAQLDPKALLASHAGNVSAAARAARIPRTTFRALLTKTELREATRRSGSA